MYDKFLLSVLALYSLSPIVGQLHRFHEILLAKVKTSIGRIGIFNGTCHGHCYSGVHLHIKNASSCFEIDKPRSLGDSQIAQWTIFSILNTQENSYLGVKW